jgi:MFS family permease
VALQVVHRKVDMSSHQQVGRALFAVTALMSAGVIIFGLATSFTVAAIAFGAARTLRGLNYPLYTAWLNANIPDSSVRATVLSVQGSADALGQSAGGPVVGLVGTIYGLRAALSLGGMLLLPALPLYWLSVRRSQQLEAAESAVTRPAS